MLASLCYAVCTDHKCGHFGQSKHENESHESGVWCARATARGVLAGISQLHGILRDGLVIGVIIGAIRAIGAVTVAGVGLRFLFAALAPVIFCRGGVSMYTNVLMFHHLECIGKCFLATIRACTTVHGVVYLFKAMQ